MKNAEKLLEALKKLYPPKIALDFGDPLQLLVATILSAQCTDDRVNKVTKDLFKKYRSLKDYSGADPEEFGQDIRSTGFYHSKAKNIINAAKMISADFGGKVPKTMEELVKLPGVARKTGNIVLTHGYGLVEGIAVDTHVKRLSYRIGLTRNTDPVKIEQDLMNIYQKKEWAYVSDLLIGHGRAVCNARKPDCPHCRVYDYCERNGV